MIEERRLFIKDRTVFYRFLPSEHPRLTVIFIHGFPFDSSMWMGQLEALGNEVQGIAYDVRGFGASQGGHGYLNMDVFANDLASLIKELKLKNVILCGISMGGYIALRTWELHAPSIAGLVLCDTNADADSNASKTKRFSSIDIILHSGKKVFADAFMKTLFASGTSKSKPEIHKHIRALVDATPVQTLCAAQLALASRTDSRHVLGRIDCPVLIIRGEEDELMTNEQAKFLNSAIKGSQLEVIKKAGHLPPVENAPDFNFVLLKFLNTYFE